MTIDAAFDELATPGVPFSQWLQERSVQSWTEGWHKAANAHLDQSCVDAVQATTGDAGMYVCLQNAGLVLFDQGVTTPSFVRFDLGDGVVGGPYKPCQHPITGESCYDPPHSFLTGSTEAPGEWLDLLDGSDHNRATMIQVFENAAAVTGVFAPACGTHTGFTNANFSQQTTSDYAEGKFGAPTTFVEALNQWLTTGKPVRIIDASQSSADKPSSVCQGTQG